jgi:hypothetical protein
MAAGPASSPARLPSSCGLNALMQDARRGALDVVVVWRFDRFARSIEQLVLALAEFRTLGIDFVSSQEALDTSTPMGKAMFTIIGAMAELERNVIRERIVAGPSTRRCTVPRAEPQLADHGQCSTEPRSLNSEPRESHGAPSLRLLASVSLQYTGHSRRAFRNLSPASARLVTLCKELLVTDLPFRNNMFLTRCQKSVPCLR